MKISIIVPIYKVEEQIIRCLGSVIKQSHSDIELIIVNDCSPDNSYQIALDFLKENCFLSQTVALEHSSNRGLSEARNSGLSVATGDYLFFLDSDDSLTTQDSISNLVKVAEQYHFPDLVIGSYQDISDNEVLGKHCLQDIYYKDQQSLYSAYASKKGIYWSACGRLIKRKLIDKNRLVFYPRLYSEDILWSFNLFRVAQNAYLSSEIVYNYYHRPGSIMSSLTEKHLDGLGIILQEMYQSFLNNKEFYSNETVSLIERYRRLYLQYLFLLEDKGTQYRKEKVSFLKEIRVPLVLNNSKYLRQGLLLRMPTTYIVKYLEFKWKDKKYRH